MLHPHPSSSESPNISYRFALASTLTAAYDGDTMGPADRLRKRV